MRVITLLEEGISQRNVANLVGTNQCSISRVAARYRAPGQFSRRPGQERTRSITAAEDNFF